jgi:nicotinamidase-related amidase
MTRPAGTALRTVVLLAALAGSLGASLEAAATIIDEWASVSVPPPPPVKPVTIDKATTALLMLDFNKQTCNMQRRPRCVASISHVKSLLTAARAAGIPVAWSLGGGGKASDLPEELAPVAGEPIVSSGVDKFANTELESFLKGKGVKTVIAVGAAANGAVLYTASTAVMRGFKVIVPVDGMSADNAYAEQYTAWHFAHAPLVSSGVTLTTIDGVKF